MNCKVYKTILVIILGLLILSRVLKTEVLVTTSIVIGFISLISTKIAELIDKYWIKLSQLLGLFMPYIILSIVFFFVLFPIAVINRIIIKKDILQLKNNKNSTFIETKTEFVPSHFEKTW